VIVDTMSQDVIIKKPKEVNRRALAQYTSKDRDVRSMTDEDFLNYSAFLMKQMDVHSTEKAREAYDTTRNFRQIRTFKQFVKSIATILVVLLIFALIALTIFAFVYLFMYFKTDPVKSVMDFFLLWTALLFVLVFILYVYLFVKMSSTIKKIITLL
jgi:hypothetical protein